jgi:molybdopterin molybdotransferase
MMTFEEAYKIVLKNAHPLAYERVPMIDCLNRVIAEDIFSDVDMPPFDKSAVDGFACRMQDISNAIGDHTVKTELIASQQMTVIETIPAGNVPEKTIGPGQCSKIMTGAMVPEGANCVVMVEDTVSAGVDRVRITCEKTAKNICFKAEDIRKGDRVIEKGTFIKPAYIAILASVGAVNPLVAVLPRVAVISTGDELTEPAGFPGKSKIRNSNAYQLLAQVKEIPGEGVYCGIAADTPESLREIITSAFRISDVVILTGGVSMGEYDYVPGIMNELDVEILFKSIAIQPGRPTVFGKRGDKFIFGLPGNPVSSFVLFELLVKPFLRKMMGHVKPVNEIRLPMASDYVRKRSSRKSLIPVKIINSEIVPLEYHGSAHIGAYPQADGIVALEIGVTSLNKGELVNVRQI